MAEKPSYEDLERRIQELEKAESERNLAENRLKKIFDNTQDAIFIHDLEGKILDVNDKMCRMYGLTREEAFEVTIEDVSSSRMSMEVLLDRWQKVLNGEKLLFEWEARRPKDESTFNVEVSIQLLSFHDKDIILANVRDITERIRTEEALRESLSRYDELVENVPVGVYILWTRATGHLEFEYVSDRWCEIHQLKREDVLSDVTRANNQVHPDDIDDFLACNRNSYLKRIPFVWEGRFLIGDDNLRWLCIESTPIVFDNGDIRWFGVTSDITERKQIEANLKREYERMDIILRATRTNIDILDSEYNLRQVDAEWEKIYGNPQGRKCYEYFMDLNKPCAGCGVPQALRTKEKIIKDELLSKEDRYIEVHIIPFQDENGEWLVAEFNIDITERKRAEAERERLQAQLNQAQKMESVGRLAGGVAHDFNNMLGVILGHTEMALLHTDDKHKLYSDLKEIRKAAERSADITKQLLAFARKQTISPKQLDLNDAVESMLNMLRRLIGEDIDLVWKPSAHLWPLKMDPSQVDQILANLCVNARDAIDGVGKLTIETGIITFDEEYSKKHAGFIPGDFVLLAVSDNGCGMHKEILDNLFEPFFTTKETGKGTGLGLATIYGIVKQNNGFINVYSEPGQGSTFKIYLPRVVAEKDTNKAVPKKKVAAGGTETILLVEDEPSILTMTRMMLERKGYSVLSATTPWEAIDLAKNHADTIHLLMTDVIMPEMNGRDLAGKITNFYPDIGLLFMSGYPSNVIAHHGVLNDGVAFIQKPFSTMEMAEKVREVLDKSC